MNILVISHTNMFRKNLRNKYDILTQHIARPVNNRDKAIYEIAIKEWNEEKRLKIW